MNAVAFLIPLGVLFSVMGLIGVVVVLLLDLRESWIMLLCAPVGPITLYSGLRIRKKKRALYQHGQVALGRVVRLGRRGTDSGSAARSAKTAYVHFAVGGTMHEAAFDAGFSEPAIGLPVWVIYDPNNPRQNIVAGKRSF